MSLDVAKLRAGVRRIVRQPGDFASAGRAWAAAYVPYAQTATSCAGGSPIGLSARQSLLATALAAAFATSTSPVDAANGIANALAAFWLAPPVPFAGATPGLVTVAVPTALAAALASQFFVSMATPPRPPDVAADQLAGLLDTWTRTVVVAHGAPAACVSPIT